MRLNLKIRFENLGLGQMTHEALGFCPTKMSNLTTATFSVHAGCSLNQGFKFRFTFAIYDHRGIS